MAGDKLRQRFETLEAEVLPLADSPTVDAIRGRGRRRRRAVRAVLVLAVLAGALMVRGAGQWVTRPEVGPVAPVPTTQPAPATPTTATPAAPTIPPTTIERSPTTTAAAARVELRPDGLGVVGFGTGEREALERLERRLGRPDERGSWRGATPFGTCPGPVRAVRWGRLYVLFTSGPTRYATGGWHLFTYQADTIQRTKVDPTYSGPNPPDPPPLRGDSPRTVAGIGVGSTLAELRRAYGRRLQVSSGEPGMIYRFRVDFGTAGELSGALTGGTPGATITSLAAGAACGE